jgi:hypothetical protein
MTRERLGELLHLARRAMGQGRGTSVSSWYNRGRSIYEAGAAGTKRIASVEGPKTRSKKDALAVLAESRAAFIAALNPGMARQLLEEMLQRRRRSAESEPRELTNLFHVAHEARITLENELARTLDCGRCGRCEVCHSLSWKRVGPDI